MVDLKTLLAKILTSLDNLTKNEYQYDWAFTTGGNEATAIPYRVRQYFSNFTGGTTELEQNFDTNTDYISFLPSSSGSHSGFVVNKSGWYLFDLCAHANNTAGEKVQVEIVTFPNTSNDATLTSWSTKFFFDNSISWLQIHVRAVVYINAGGVVAPTFQKYLPNDSTSTLRLRYISMSLIRMCD